MTERPERTERHAGASGLRAVILAGGKGTRLHPFTASFPKPLVPLGDVPIVEVLMRRLIRYGVTDITLSLGHLAELVQAYFAHRRQLTDRVALQYVIEDEPLGTAGSLALISGLDRTFLAMNGDLLTNLDLDALVRFHSEQDALLTVATHTRCVKIDLGVLEFDERRQIRRYLEKPETQYHVSMGIYVYEPRVLEYIARGTYLDFPDLVLRLLEHGERVCAYPTDCIWLDIGRPDDYSRAQELFTQAADAF
jgi:NDP-mannose synthase